MTSIGASSQYFTANSTGTAASATGADAVAIGVGASATADNATAIGPNSVADTANTVSVGYAGGGERKIVNVAAGDLSASSTRRSTAASSMRPTSR